MDYPDPDVIRVGDTYYLISTTMHFYPGGVILESKDLINWKIVTYVFDALESSAETRMENELVDYSGGMWAPCLRYHDGKFYILFGKHSGKSQTYLFSSDRIEGPYTKKVFDQYYHDCSLLFDDNKIYMTYGNRNIHLVELKNDLSGVIDETDTVVISDGDDVPLGYEGSHIYKINGMYYIFLVNWPKDSMRTQWCYRSKTITGEYEGRAIYFEDGGLNGHGIAQGGVVDTPSGDYFSVLFQDRGACGRMPVLTKVEWENGWPKLSQYQDYESKIIDNGNISELWTSEFCKKDKLDGNEPIINKQWQWNHLPDSELWSVDSDGNLKITTDKLSINPTHAKNMLTQRMVYPECACEVVVDGAMLNNGDLAGLCALQSKYGFIGITKQAGEYYLVTIIQSDENVMSSPVSGDCLPGRVVESIRLESDHIKVRLEADFTDLKDELYFFYEKDGMMIKVGNELKMEFRLDHFTGYRFGLCVYSTKETGGSALFKKFEYIV